MMWCSGVRSSWRSCAPGSMLTAPRSRAGRPPELRLDLLEQPGEIDGLGVEVVAARCDRLLPVARHGVRGERDHRDRAGLGGRLDPAGRPPPRPSPPPPSPPGAPPPPPTPPPPPPP